MIKFVKREQTQKQKGIKMIKLIASDIDGTLVKDGTLMINPEYMNVINKLVDQGIIFIVCSGRQFSSERKLFAPIADKLYYISDGGTVVRTPDKILKTYPMDEELWKNMCRMVRYSAELRLLCRDTGLWFCRRCRKPNVPLAPRFIRLRYARNE